MFALLNVLLFRLDVCFPLYLVGWCFELFVSVNYSDVWLSVWLLDGCLMDVLLLFGVGGYTVFAF